MPGQAQATVVGEGGAPGPTLAAWRARGRHRFDPVQFRFIEALARRAADRMADQSAHPAAGQLADPSAEQTASGQLLQQVLQGRLATLMAAYGQRQAQAQADAQACVDQAVARFPAASDSLRQGLASGDFKALRRLIAALENPAPARWLAELVHHVDRQASPPAKGQTADPASVLAGVSAGVPSGPPLELKAVRDFRSTWARLSVDQQLTRSLARIPDQAGPLNSQLLVLRSLQLMRDVSPAYLGRFMSYVDALLWLDEAGVPAAPVQAATPRGDADKKRRPGRGKAG